MASRLLSVYLMGLMYSGVVILPAVIVYWVVAPVTAGVILGGVLLLALLSVFVLTLSCALGWVVAKISLKLKNKSFITMLVSLVFIGVYYFFVFRAQTFIKELVGNAAAYGDSIKGAAYPLYLLGQVGTGDRSERIRTYNFPQDRVTDHRIGLTLRNLQGVLDGDLDRVVEPLILADREEKLKQSSTEEGK